MLMLGARIGSHLLLNRLQSRTTYELRAQLSNRILATPLRRLEELGTYRLLATLVDDIGSLTQSLLCIPVILLNACIVLGCLAYLAMLSRVDRRQARPHPSRPRRPCHGSKGDREHYRQHFATVFSDFHLFEALLGLASADLADRARGYLERMQLAHKVGSDASGALSTTQLSTGQRKRLALLTAFLENRPVYLFGKASHTDRALEKTKALEPTLR